MNVCIYVYTYICIYIYIEREREREDLEPPLEGGGCRHPEGARGMRPPVNLMGPPN